MLLSKRIALLSLITVPSWSAMSHAESDDEKHPEMDQIIVTATPLSSAVEALAQPTSVLIGDELVHKQSTSIGETLSQEPGLSSSYVGPVSSRPVIRGQFGERVRVLSNGLDSLDASALSEDHQVTVEGLLAERIEIIRGPATLLYGSGASGGLVNVVDKRMVEQLPDTSLSGGIALGADTAVGRREGAVRALLDAGDVAISADAFVRSTDDVEIPGFAESAAFREQEMIAGDDTESAADEQTGVIENTSSDASGGALGVSYIGGRGHVGLVLSGFDSKYGVPGHSEEAEPLPMPSEDDSVRIDLEQTRLDANAQFDLRGDLLQGIRIHAALNDYGHEEREGPDVGTRYDVQGTDTRIELRHVGLKGLEGAVGLQYKRTDFGADGDEAFVPSSDTRRSSVFAFEEYRLSSSWALQGSARYEWQSITGSTLQQKYEDGATGASLGAIWRPHEVMRLSANYSLTERHPTATELYADGPHVAAQRYERGSVTLGNGLLNTERSANLDLTLHGDFGRAEWSVTAFRNRISDYILLRPTAQMIDELAVFDFDQADVEFTGVEAEMLLELVKRNDRHLHVGAFVDFVDGEERGNSAALPRIPPKRLGVSLQGGWNSAEATLEATFAADQNEVAENELPTAGYTLVNATLGYSFAALDLHVFLRGTNLLNEDIRQHTSQLKDFLPLPGRSLHVGLRYDF